MRVIAPIIPASLLVACAQSPDLGAVFDGSRGQWVDLTYPFSSETIYWPTAQSFALERLDYGMTEAGYFYAANNFSAAEHGGTHLDAPIHFAEGRYTSDQIPFDRLIGPVVVIDVTDSAAANPDYLVRAADIEGWIAAHGDLPQGAILLIRTGWGAYWPDRSRYLGTAVLGAEAVPHLHFPGLAPEAARWIVNQGAVHAIGIDTPSIDFGQSQTFESHRILYEANIPGFENVAHLDRLPAAGSYVVALPMKIEGGSGGPLRIVAFLP